MKSELEIDDLSEISQISVSNFIKAVRLREKIVAILETKTPRIFIGTTGNAYLQIDMRNQHDEQVRESVHKLTKAFGKINKTQSTQGFLKYRLEKNGITVSINTSQCFYGGAPLVEKYPRTKAYCPLEKLKEASS